MFLTAAFLQFTYKELTDHLLWMVLLTFLILRGPGALSLDYFIAKHLERSAIPFSRSLYWTTVFLMIHPAAVRACGPPLARLAVVELAVALRSPPGERDSSACFSLGLRPGLRRSFSRL